MRNIHLYISQWSMFGGTPGLTLFSFDTETGAVTPVKQLDNTHAFGCSVIDPEKRIFYICNEINLRDEVGYDTGRIYGYQLSPETGDLTELFHQDTYCPFPDYIAFDPDRKFMIVPHHSWATSITTVEKDALGRYVPVQRFMDSIIDLFSMNPDGTIRELVDVRKHSFDKLTRDFEGKITVPHPHCAVRSPSGKLYAVCDKGDCHLYLYEIDHAAGKLVQKNRFMTDAPLSEPRYCAFHPTLPYLFVNHEHSGNGTLMVTALRYDEEGHLELINKVDCLDPEFEGRAMGQAFCISPDGKYLYNMLQGVCHMAVLKVNEETGEVSLIQRVPIPGGRPRHCALSPDGQFLVTACITGEVLVYAVNADGTLTATDRGATLPGSAYVTFYDPN